MQSTSSVQAEATLRYFGYHRNCIITFGLVTLENSKVPQLLENAVRPENPVFGRELIENAFLNISAKSYFKVSLGWSVAKRPAKRHQPGYKTSLFASYLNHNYIWHMKKGEKVRDVIYFLEIKDLSNNPIYLSTSPSLRGVVKLAAQVVSNMDSYSKVYREFSELDGVFAGVYFALNPHQTLISKGSRHLFVIIRSSKVQHIGAEDLHDKLTNIQHTHFSRLPGYSDAFPDPVPHRSSSSSDS